MFDSTAGDVCRCLGCVLSRVQQGATPPDPPAACASVLHEQEKSEPFLFLECFPVTQTCLKKIYQNFTIKLFLIHLRGGVNSPNEGSYLCSHLFNIDQNSILFHI